MPTKIFFSWQSDTPNKVGRSLILAVLEDVIIDLKADADIEEAFREEIEVDHDTKNVAGTPPIVDTIFNKIDDASIFIADLTFAGKRPNGDPIPNPNVLIEYGWALKVLTFKKILLVMNTAYGNPTDDQLPFDIKHLRRPIQYECPETLGKPERTKVAEILRKQLKDAIQAILKTENTQKSIQAPFIGKSQVSPGLFCYINQPMGILFFNSLSGKQFKIKLKDGNPTWMRLQPTTAQEKTWTIAELKGATADTGDLIFPLYCRGAYEFSHIRTQDGFGIFASNDYKREETDSVVMVFQNGEIWSVETHTIDACKSETPFIPLPEEELAESLEQYANALARLGINRPYRWQLGMKGIEGRRLAIKIQPDSPHIRWSGPSLVDQVECNGAFNLGDDPQSTLSPFFEKVYDICGSERPAWLNKKR
jgi:hypothetical protein